MTLLGLTEAEVPRLLVQEGAWWRQRASDSRLPSLTGVRELGLPDLWHGWYGEVPVAYAVAHGASRAVEPVHVLGTCGTPVVVQIGSCHGLQPNVRAGDIVLSERATIGEGVSQYYGGKAVATANLGRVTRAASLFAGRDMHTHRGSTITAGASLAQPAGLLRKWAAAGHLAVDTETSAVFSAASALGMRAASLQFVRLQQPGEEWADETDEAVQAAHARASRAVFEVALALA